MDEEEHDINEKSSFLAVMAGTVVLGVIAMVLATLFNIPVLALLKWNLDDVLVGIIATLPLVLFLWWFSKTDIPTLVEFRNSQIEFFAEIGFEFTWPRIIMMSLGAGVFEELLFRGVVQSWIATGAGVVVAVIITNIIFGAMHWRTVLYAAIAGVVGLWMSIIFLFTDNLVTPMVTHALYDAVALEYTRRALANAQPTA